MEAVTFPDPRVRSYANEHFVTVRLDAYEDGAALARYGLEAIPSTVALSPGGDVLGLQDGFLDPGPFLDWMVAAKLKFEGVPPPAEDE